MSSPTHKEDVNWSSTAPAFPVRLYDMVNKAEADGYAHIISWRPDGRGFIIHKHKEFQEDILPKFFLGGFARLARILRRHGFQRLGKENDGRGMLLVFSDEFYT